MYLLGCASMSEKVIYNAAKTPRHQERQRTCSGVPAVMLETVQHASLRMASLGACRMSILSMGRTPALSTACVSVSLPVTMLPRVRSAGETTDELECLGEMGGVRCSGG